jgi:hypothetical protein
MSTAPLLDTSEDAATFRQCDGDMRRAMRDQIGFRTLMGISGLRITPTKYGIALPVSHGYTVTVDLAGNDTYVVRRLFTRGTKIWLHGEAREVSCERLSEVAWYASCFNSHDADEWMHQSLSRRVLALLLGWGLVG